MHCSYPQVLILMEVHGGTILILGITNTSVREYCLLNCSINMPVAIDVIIILYILMYCTLCTLLLFLSAVCDVQGRLGLKSRLNPVQTG